MLLSFYCWSDLFSEFGNYFDVYSFFNDYKWPSDFLKRIINREIDNFVWLGLVDLQNTVSWVKCCLPVKKCGLGIKRLHLFNIALLGKSAQKFISKSTFIFYFL